MGWPKLLFSYC